MYRPVNTAGQFAVQQFALLNEHLKNNFRDFDIRLAAIEKTNNELKLKHDQSARTLADVCGSSLLHEESIARLKNDVTYLSEQLKLTDDGKVEA